MSARLRAARERAGLTIEDISASTKLAPATLRALERGDFTKLPGEFYTRAFLRTYARELHLSPDAIVGEFDAAREAAEVAPDDRATRERDVAVAPRVSAPVSDPWWRGPWASIAGLANNAGVVIALVMVLLAVAVARNRPAAPPAPEPGAVGTSGSTAATPAVSAGTPAEAPVADRLVIEIQPAGSMWVTGAADGKRVLYRLLAPGERVRVEARKEVAFRVGDAAAFTYTINGVAGKPIGGPGEVRDVLITRENYQTFRR